MIFFLSIHIRNNLDLLNNRDMKKCKKKFWSHWLISLIMYISTLGTEIVTIFFLHDLYSDYIVIIFVVFIASSK